MPGPTTATHRTDASLMFQAACTEIDRLTAVRDAAASRGASARAHVTQTDLDRLALLRDAFAETLTDEFVAAHPDHGLPRRRQPSRAHVLIAPTTAETTTEVETHHGCRLAAHGGQVVWNPSYGTGHPEPLTEHQARAMAERKAPCGGTYVTRTETVTTTTTAWEEMPAV